MKVQDLKELLTDILDTLDYYEDNDEINMRANTYGLGSTFLSTYNGYLDLTNIEDAIERGEE